MSNLQLPDKYKSFLDEFLSNIRIDDRIHKVVLFGSCARGETTGKSDIDILVTTKHQLDEEAELEFYDYLPNQRSENYIPCDLIVMSDQRYEDNKFTTGYVQKYINLEGVDLKTQMQTC